MTGGRGMSVDPDLAEKTVKVGGVSVGQLGGME
jgi:hypothetical protein